MGASVHAPLDGVFRVVDLSAGIGGAYCTKILADAGAEVILVEPPGGSALRARTASGQPVDPRHGGVLFQYLSCSKASVVADVADPGDREFLHALVRGADAVVWSWESPQCRHPAFAPAALRALATHALVLAVTPFGLEEKWRDRPANEFTLQARAGSAWNHGSGPAGEPIMFGGSHADWTIGAAGALALLIGRTRALRTGAGELIDLAALDVLHLTHYMFGPTFLDLAGRPHRTRRYDPIPDVHAARDGWVGFWVTTGQQWLDFCTMLGREDWLADSSLATMDGRGMRHEEMVGAIDAWVAERTVAEVIDFASGLRIPVAPIGNGRTLPTFDHFVERGMYGRHPRTGVVQPVPWYRFSGGAGPRPSAPSPTLGEDSARYRAARLEPLTPRPAAPRTGDTHPFDDLRFADMTAFWAGPIIAHAFACLGADVIHVESAKRPDGIRMAVTRPMSQDGWWESSPFFNGTNTNKRGLAVDLQTADGRAILLQLIEHCDVLVENYSPRVMGQLGLDYEALRRVKPDLIMVRAPAFGTSGPWTDRVGYAPTIDQAGGAAWVTGVPGGRPLMVGAASDAVGGWHGTIAILLALEHRRRTGEGTLIESPQIGPALQSTAEQVIEYSAHGVVLDRVGNRSWTLAPQGVYRTRDIERGFGMAADDWLAVSVEDEAQWLALCAVIGAADLAAEPALRAVEGRRAAHDRIDAAIGAWCRELRADEASDRLAAAGVPAAPVVNPADMAEVGSVRRRGLYEDVTHPVAGRMRIIGFPIRSSAGPGAWHRTPAPCLGEHNEAILRDLLGRSGAEIEDLRRREIIGEKAQKFLGW
ncbi:MAG: CoA transferase [Gammaproteobacteria bacterium]